MATELQLGRHQASGLVDVLDRVLDKGLVIAGDIKVSLAEVELLTIRIRLIVCSIDKAQEVGLDWWKYDPHLAPENRTLREENEDLKRRVRLLETQMTSPAKKLSAKNKKKSTQSRSADGGSAHGQDTTE